MRENAQSKEPQNKLLFCIRKQVNYLRACIRMDQDQSLLVTIIRLIYLSDITDTLPIIRIKSLLLIKPRERNMNHTSIGIKNAM